MITALLETFGDFQNVRIPEWFRPFNPREQAETRAGAGYERNLPHWRYEGATYFLTFRLADALPAVVLEEMREAAAKHTMRVEAARKAHGGVLPSAFREEAEAYQRECLTKLENWLDQGLGSCVLRDPAPRRTVADAMLHFDHERCRMAAFTIMPNHVHAICHPLPGWPLEELAGSWKKFTARWINQHLGRSGTLWQQETYDRIVRDTAHFRKVVRYLVRNPLRAKLQDAETTVWVNEEILPEPTQQHGCVA